MVHRLELATSAISAVRIWHAASCSKSGIEEVWVKIRDEALISLPPLSFSVGAVFAAKYVPILCVFVFAVPAPSYYRTKTWLPARPPLPATLPFFFSDFFCKFSYGPLEEEAGGFFSVLGERVFVSRSLYRMSVITLADIVSEPLEIIQRSIEKNMVAGESMGRQQLAKDIRFRSLHSMISLFGMTLWLNIKCSLVGIEGYLADVEHVDVLLMLSIVMTACLVAFSIASTTYNLMHKFFLFYPHRNTLHPGMWDEETNDYVKDIFGKIAFLEKPSDRRRAKILAYSGVVIQMFSAAGAIFLVAYAMLKLYNIVFICHVRPWNFNYCVSLDS